MASLVFQGQRVRLPMQSTWVRSLGCWEDLLEEEMATHSSMLAWETHGQGRLGGKLQSIGSQHQTDLATTQQPGGKRGCHRAETGQKIPNT